MDIFRKNDLNLLKFTICSVFFVTPIESVGISEESSSFSIVKLVVLLLFIVWFFKSRKVEHNSVTRFFVTMGAYWLMSCVWALSPTIAFSNLVNFYLPSLLLIMVIGENIINCTDIRNILASYLFGCIVLALYCHTSRAEILANAMYADMERVTALGHDQNELSFLLVMGLAVALHGIQNYSRKWIKLVLLLCSLLFIYAVLLTGSRTGMIMVLSVVILFVLNNKQYTTFLLPILIIGFPLFISQIPTSSIERILNTKESLSSGDISNRGDIWSRGFRAFADENFILGVGYQNFSEMMRIYYGHGCAAHNTYISYLITGGIFGMLFLWGILWKMFTYCVSIVKSTKNSYWYAYLFPLLIAMITLETQYKRWIFLIALVLYKAYVIQRTEQETYLTK